jgi:signal transduction histidine kinase
MTRTGIAPRWSQALVVTPFVLLALLRCFGYVVPMNWEWELYDIAARHLVPPAPTTDEVVVVEIDNDTLFELEERWPLSRDTWTRFIRKLDSAKPAVIALDMIFDQPSDDTCREILEDIRSSLERPGELPSGLDPAELIDSHIALIDPDARLEAAIAESGRVVLGEILPSTQESIYISRDPGVIRSIPSIHSAARDHGVLNSYRSWDGVLRRYRYLTFVDGIRRPSLALSAVLNALPAERMDGLIARISELDDGAPLVRFPAGVIHLRFSDVLYHSDRASLETMLRGRIVLVGETASGMQEQHPTPIDTVVAGVDIHAFAIMNLLSDTHATSHGAAAWAGLALTLLLLAAAFLATERVPMAWLPAIALGCWALHLFLMYLLLVQAGWLIGFIPVGGGALVLVATEALFRVRAMDRHRREVTDKERLNEAKTEFIATISHELRTPLTSIRGSLGLVAGGAVGPIPEQADELIRIAHNNTERLIRLVNDFLDFQKIAAGKMEFHFDTVELHPLIENAVTANQAFAEQFGVHFVIETEPLPDGDGTRTPWVVADADLITQAITNLLSNAAKFSPSGASVIVRIRQTGERVRVMIIDQGPGIAEDFRSRIFTKFAQAADSTSSSRAKGTGLGLSIVKLIVEEHGGSVGFDTELDKGTTFYIDMTLAQAPN